MARNLLQEHLYGDLLVSSQGYHTDFALGMTYSLGFDALLTAQLAFGMLGDTDEKAVQSPHLLLEAILKNRDKLVIFCNKGSIAKPPCTRKVYSLLEKNIFQVFNSNEKTANFHPKMWLIREVNNDNSKDVLLKLIVSSRNMAYSDQIDCITCMTGKVGNVQIKNKKHTILRTFIEKVAYFSKISGEQLERVESLSKDLERVENFDVDKPFDDYDFYPYLFREDFGLGNVEDYLCSNESIIVSPFIDKSLLKRINPKRKGQRALITRKEFVDAEIFDMFDSKGGVFITLDDLASQGMDIHAKMYFVNNDRDNQYLYLGSANATKSAFERNGELLLRLKFEYGNSKYNQFLKEFYEEGSKGSKFIRILNKPSEKISSSTRWDKAELAMKDRMCADDLKAIICKHRDDTYSVKVIPSFKKQEKPIYIAPLQREDMRREWRGSVEFDGLAAVDLSEFYIVSSQTDEEKQYEAVIKITTEGMPKERDAAIYKSIIKNQHDFVKFLDLMLSDSPAQYLSRETLLMEKNHGEADKNGYKYSQIYEKLLKVAAMNPKQISQIGDILGKLDSDTVPKEFSKIFEKFSSALKLTYEEHTLGFSKSNS